MTSGTFSTLSATTTAAARMWPSAIKGTTTWVTWAMRRTPPKTIRPSRITIRVPVTAGATAKAFSMLAAMLLVCTPGSSRPQANIVTTANTIAYTRQPGPFSM